MFSGVVCPDFIRDQWKERLIIDLDPSYPLDLTFEPENLAADLSFGGYVTRCSFPYGAVYVVADRSTGRGIVLDQNMPESVKKGREAGDTPSDAKAPLLRTVDGSATVEKPAASATEEPAPSDEAKVAERRAAFKVIDGGN